MPMNFDKLTVYEDYYIPILIIIMLTIFVVSIYHLDNEFVDIKWVSEIFKHITQIYIYI